MRMFLCQPMCLYHSLGKPRLFPRCSCIKEQDKKAGLKPVGLPRPEVFGLTRPRAKLISWQVI